MATMSYMNNSHMLIQGVSGGIVNILRCDSMDYSEKNKFI